jgi:hypothetical protein
MMGVTSHLRRRDAEEKDQQQYHAVAGDYLDAMLEESRFTASRWWRSDKQGYLGLSWWGIAIASTHISDSGPYLQLLNHDLAAASVRPLSSLHTSPPVQRHPYLGATADIVLRFGQF